MAEEFEPIRENIKKQERNQSIIQLVIAFSIVIPITWIMYTIILDEILLILIKSTLLIMLYIVINNTYSKLDDGILYPFLSIGPKYNKLQELKKVLDNYSEFHKIYPILHTVFRNFELVSNGKGHLECIGETWDGQIKYIDPSGVQKLLKNTKEIYEIKVEYFREISPYNYGPLEIKIVVYTSGNIQRIDVPSEQSKRIGLLYFTDILTELQPQKIPKYIEPPISRKNVNSETIKIRGMLTPFGISSIISIGLFLVIFCFPIIQYPWWSFIPILILIAFLSVTLTSSLTDKEFFMDDKGFQYWFGGTLVFDIDWLQIRSIDCWSIGHFTYHVTIDDGLNAYNLRSLYNTKRVLRKVFQKIARLEGIRVIDSLNWMK